jgi:antitoxin CptB
MSISEPENRLANRRRQLAYRASHRGIKEMDLLLGGYASRNLERLSDDELDRFENLMEAPDQQLLAWLTGVEPVPADVDAELLGAILADAMRASK